MSPVHAQYARVRASRAYARPPDITGWYSAAQGYGAAYLEAAPPVVIASKPVSRTGPEKLLRHNSCARGRHMKPLGQGDRLIWGHGYIPQPAVQTTASDPGMA